MFAKYCSGAMGLDETIADAAAQLKTIYGG
jgi:hypothetical protein